MHHRRSLTVAATLLAMVPAFTLSAQMIGSGTRLTDLMNEAPGVRFFHNEHGALSSVYGVPMATGKTPLASAETFIARHQGVFVADHGRFVLSESPNGGFVEGVMYDRAAGQYKFSQVVYQQSAGGLPVFRSTVSLLIRNEFGFPVVQANAAVRDLKGFRPAQAAGNPEEPGEFAQQRVTQRMIRNARRVLGFDGVLVGTPQTVIWAGLDGMVVDPAVAVVFSLEFDNGDQATYRKRLFVAHAGTGEILYTENEVHEFTDIEGSVKGNATEGVGADICGPESPVGMPYARVVLNGQNHFADVNGDFLIPHGGTTEVTLTTEVRGRWFRVVNPSGAPPEQLSMNVVPPGPADFLFNAANSTEQRRSEVNTYLHANIIRDWVLSYDPAFPVIANQQDWPINVNINANCNAFYNGNSINFYTSGGGCANTGFSSVVYHEYGHHLVNVGSSGGQGAYGEGMSDTVAALIGRDSRLGVGFQNNCNNGIRNANNNCLYLASGCSTCGSAIHSCGQLISGCVWSTRANLQQTEPQDFEDIIASLTIASIRRHNYSGINPQITIDFLILDDNDSNINNGTPHYDEINDGFGDHDMPGPTLPNLAFDYPDGRPEFADPRGGTTFRVTVEPLRSEPQPGTGLLHIDLGNGFETFPLQEVAANEYDVEIPASSCGRVLRWYVSAETTTGTVVTDPVDAPTAFHTVISGVPGAVVFEDNFQNNMGWTVENVSLADGAWSRGVPVNGGRGDPPSDYDGSGACYVTDNVAGNSDVDGGPTRLVSPVFSLAGVDDAIVSFARWFTNDDRDIDRLDVHISNNGGTSWTLVASYPHFDGWQKSSFLVSSVTTPTATMRLRFSATDNPNDSVTEAGVDAVKVQALTCSTGAADLTAFDVLTGTLTSGVLSDLVDSDDLRVQTRSGFGSTFTDLHNMTIRVEANSGAASPGEIDLTIESRISHTSGTAQVRLWNWNTSQYTLVGSYAIGQTETPVSINDIPAGNYINGSGDIRLTIKHVVVVPVFAFQFDSFFDQVELVVD